MNPARRPRRNENPFSCMFVQSVPVPVLSSSKHRFTRSNRCDSAPLFRTIRFCVLNSLSTPTVNQDLSSLETADTVSASSPPAPSQPRRDPELEALDILEWERLSSYVARHARTDGGRAKAEKGLEIGHDRARSETLLGETREMLRLVHELGRDVPLAGASQVSGIARDASKGRTLSGRELRSVASTLAAGRATRRALEAAHTAHGGVDLLLAHARAARTWPDVEQEIIVKIDDFGDVLDVADERLASARAERAEVLARVRETLRGLMSQHAEAIQDRIVTQRYDRFVIAVKVGKKGMFRGATVHDVSASGNTAYIEPAQVRAMNDRLRALAAIEKTRVRAVLLKLSETIAPIADDIVALCEGLSCIDAAGARAETAVQLDAVDVRFLDDAEDSIALRGVRHPLLALTAKSSDEDGDWKSQVIPQDFLVPEGVRCVCITGPNTGGKTVALKTIGLVSLMAKAGLFIPATKPLDNDGVLKLPYFDKVLLDAGDDQSIVQSLSTFSGHVERIKRILGATTAQSLVLMDEVGSGTDPQEGAALGAAILRSLAVGQRAALAMATTHHGELKMLKYASDGTGSLFENCSVQFDDVNMRPTYRLQWGIPGRSNALAIAQRLGLESGIIDDARQLLIGGEGTSRVDFERLIKGLEQQKREADDAARVASEARSEATVLRQEAQTRLQKLADAEEKLRSNQRAAVDAEIEQAKKSIAGVIRELQRGGQSAQKAAAATGKLKRIQKSVSKDLDAAQGNLGGGDSEENSGELVFEVGDSVRVARMGTSFVDVMEIKGNDVVVAIGSLSAKVKRTEILEVKEKPTAAVRTRMRKIELDARKKKKKTPVMRTAANTVDVRGERVDAAETLVEEAMAKAIPLGALWIIHGHGTGRLRNGIREFLRGHHLVESYRKADESDGGSGVTVVELK